MLFQEAKKYLDQFIRDEYKDHIWNDKEVIWRHPLDDSIRPEIIAEGYTDGRIVSVTVNQTIFLNEEAKQLLQCGRLSIIGHRVKMMPDDDIDRPAYFYGVKKEVAFK